VVLYEETKEKELGSMIRWDEEEEAKVGNQSRSD
jgi:hypothetical protein